MSTIKSVVDGSNPSLQTIIAGQNPNGETKKTQTVFEGVRANPTPDEVVVVLVSDSQQFDIDSPVVELVKSPPQNGSMTQSENGTTPTEKSVSSNPSDTPIDRSAMEIQPAEKFPYNPRARMIGDGLGGAINAKRSAQAALVAIKESPQGKGVEVSEISTKTARSLFATKQVNNMAWGMVNAILIPKAKDVVRVIAGNDTPEYQVSSAAGFMAGAATTVLFIPTTLIFNKSTTENIPVRTSTVEFLKTLKHNPTGTLKICYASKTALHQIATSGLFGAVFVAVNDFTYSKLMNFANAHDQEGKSSPMQKAMICGAISTGVAGLSAIATSSYFDMQAKACAHESNTKLKTQIVAKEEITPQSTQAPKEPIAKTGTALETASKEGTKVVEKTVTNELSTLARYGRNVLRTTKLWLPFMIFTGILSPIVHAWEQGELHIPGINQPSSQKEGDKNAVSEENPVFSDGNLSASLNDTIDRLEPGVDGEWTLRPSDDSFDEGTSNYSTLIDTIDRLEPGLDGEWTLRPSDDDSSSVDDDTKSDTKVESGTTDPSDEADSTLEAMGFGGY